MATPRLGIIGRRGFLRTTAVVTAGLPFGFVYTRRASAASPYGELVPDPDGILDLPAGFSYQILETKGDLMDDGYQVPGRADGMGAFAGPGGTIILMRNHELSPGDTDEGPYTEEQPDPPEEAWDPVAMGGVTRLVLDGESFERLSSNLVLQGTNRNCAGGVSPWGWLSCEENVDDGHGYVFVCPLDAESIQALQPVTGYGRCNHEAAAVDPATNVCYLTEDRGDSCIYRFVPTSKDAPFEGILQALRVVDDDGFVTNNMKVGDTVSIAWVDIDTPDPVGDTLREEAQQKGAALFVRGEGIWFFEGTIYICSTSGGPAAAGQIFTLVDDGDTGTLELIAMSTDKNVLEKPDNITVAPWGELYIAEDGDNDNFLRGVTEAGEVYPFARNAISSSEFAGVCFSPDGKAMFVNIQSDGLTFVITGPFPDVDNETDTDTDTDSDGSNSETDSDTDGETDSETGATETGATDGGSETGMTTTDAGETETTAGPGTGGESDSATTEGADGEGCGCTSSDSPSSGLGLGLTAAAMFGARLIRRSPSDTDSDRSDS